MPIIIIVSLFAAAYIGYRVWELRRQRRNLRHVERGEPLEGHMADLD